MLFIKIIIVLLFLLKCKW